MPFVMTNERCEAMRAEQPDSIEDGLSIPTIRYRSMAALPSFQPHPVEPEPDRPTVDETLGFAWRRGVRAAIRRLGGAELDRMPGRGAVASKGDSGNGPGQLIELWALNMSSIPLKQLDVRIVSSKVSISKQLLH
jgi:hypothetical protein